MTRARRLLERRLVQPTAAGKRAYRLLTAFIILVGIWWFSWISDYLDAVHLSHGKNLIAAVDAFVTRIAISIALAMSMVGTASIYKGWRTLVHGEYPYPGMWVDHEVTLLFGETAAARARKTLLGGSCWILAAGPIAWIMYRMLDVLYTV